MSQENSFDITDIKNINIDELVSSSLESSDNQDETNPNDKSLSEKFEEERIVWNSKIDTLSKKLGKIVTVQELMTDIYTERQRAVDYYHYIISLLIKINKKYRKDYSNKYHYYTYLAQERFPNETTKQTKILTELEDLVEKKDLLEQHSKFITESIKNIDHIIWAITQRLKIEDIARGK